MKQSICVKAAFTLVEVLIVVAVIAALSALLLPVGAGMVGKGKDTACLSQMRQWGIALNCYLADNAGRLPDEGAEENPSWSQTTSVNNATAWYNVLPPYVNQKGMAELSGLERKAIYRGVQSGILQCPRATWAGTEENAAGPRFSYAFNSKIFGGGVDRFSVYQVGSGSGPNVNNRLIGLSTTAILLDARASVKEPKAVSGMNNDAGTAQSYTRRASNRHGAAFRAAGVIHILFLDGRVVGYPASEIMNSSGRNINTSSVIWNPSNPDEA